MPLLPQPPFVRIALRMAEIGADVDYLDQAGIAAPVTIRHRRKVQTVRGERPAITIIFVGDVPEPGDGLNAWEQRRRATFDIQADVELSPGTDVTGLETAGLMLAAFVRALRVEGSPLLELVDWVEEGEIEPEDRAQPEDGRLVRTLELLYRARSDDGNALLGSEENG